MRQTTAAMTLDNCNRLASLIDTLGSEGASRFATKDSVSALQNKAAGIISAYLDKATDSDWVNYATQPELPGLYWMFTAGMESIVVVVFTDGIVRRLDSRSDEAITVTHGAWQRIAINPAT